MQLKLITNVAVIGGTAGYSPCYMFKDVTNNRILLGHFEKNVVGNTTTYDLQLSTRQDIIVAVGTGMIVLLGGVTPADFYDGDSSVYNTVTVNGYKYTDISQVDNLPETAQQLWAKATSTPVKSFLGNGIILANYFPVLGGGGVIPPIGGIGGNPSLVDPILTQEDKDKLAEIEKEKKRKDGMYGFVSSLKGTDSSSFAYKFGSWVQDNFLLFLLVGLLAWNYVIQPNFFPTTTLLTFGDTKKKALELLEGGKKSNRRRSSNLKNRLKGRKNKR